MHRVGHCVCVQSVMINKACSSNLRLNIQLIDFLLQEEKQQALVLFIHYFRAEKVVACGNSKREVVSVMLYFLKKEKSPPGLSTAAL